MSYLFDPNEYNKEPQKKESPGFHFKIERLIPYSESEMIQDEITLDEVMSIAKIYGFSSSRVDKLIKAKKYRIYRRVKENAG